jgi:lactoylglutathione lyase
MHQQLDEVKWAMLEEWSRTKRAPKHAAWMHAPN